MLLLCGLTASFGQKSSVMILGLPFGSAYEDYLSSFKEKGFTGQMQVIEFSKNFKIDHIYGTFMTYKCSIEMYASKLTHSVYMMKIHFSLLQYKDIPSEVQCRTIISKFEEKYGKATYMRSKNVVQTFEDSSTATWKLDDNIDMEFLYFNPDGCKVTYGGENALNGIFQNEVEQYNRQKELEIQEKLSGIDF